MKPLALSTLILIFPMGVAAGCSSEDSAGGAGGAGNCEDPALSCFDACMCRSNDAANCKLGCPSGTGGSAGKGGTSTGGTGGSGATGGTGGTGTGGTGGTPPTGPVGKCSDTPPPGAPKPAAPKAFTGGTCPALVPGMNNIQSTTARQFILVVPTGGPQANEKLPVVFLWHWLGGDANGFLTRGEVQKAADAQRFIAVIPEAKSGSIFKWPYSAVDSQAALDEELRFFDDMLSCVSQQFGVNENCVSTAGVSAGALWSAQLASYRSEYLSSFVSLSGGTGGAIKPWGNPTHKLPAIVLWGGPTDTCIVINFEQTSKDLEQHLTADGHFFIECVHNCQHGEPPVESGTTSKYQMLFDFVMDHPFWTGVGNSPYRASGIPASFPPWCGIGAGSATPRTGACPPASC